MSRFADHLLQDLVREHGRTLADADRPQPGPAGMSAVLQRSRMLAGSTLGLAGVAAAVVFALGGTAATAPAFAITTSSDGSVLVQLNHATGQDLPQVNRKLAAMETGEAITISEATGPATVTGPVTCSPSPGVAGPTVKVLEGSDGTAVINAGQSGGDTAEGTFHVARCVAISDTGSGHSGSTGAG